MYIFSKSSIRRNPFIICDLRSVLFPAGVVPSRFSVSLALADAGLGETQGLDLSAMDARFRGLATGPLRVTRRSKNGDFEKRVNIERRPRFGEIWWPWNFGIPGETRILMARKGNASQEWLNSSSEIVRICPDAIKRSLSESLSESTISLGGGSMPWIALIYVARAAACFSDLDLFTPGVWGSLVFPLTVWPHWGVLTVRVKARCLIEVFSYASGIFPANSHTK